MKIGFLGAGLMGAGFVRRFLKNGYAVQVWNRNAEKARALEADGAAACADAGSAVDGVNRIHVMLADDAAVDGVLEPLRGRIPADTWIVDHSTTAPSPTAERAARWSERGRVYLHAPVFMGPKHAEEGVGTILVSGDPGRVDAIMPELQKMTTKVIRLGDKPDTAAAYKLFGNLVLIGVQGILADVVRLAHAVGIPPEEAVSLFTKFNPGEGLPGRAAKIAAGPYDPPSFTIAMARKDVRLMIEESARHDVELAVMPLIAELYDGAIGRGEGALDTTAAFRYPLNEPH